jgi:hypothetical protein
MVETGANVRHVCYGFGMTLSQGYMRFPFALGLVVALLGPPVSEAADRKQASDPWIASVRLIRDGALDGSGIYLKSGLVITAAHLTAAEAKMGVQIAGVALPATVLKQGSFEDVDLTLLSIDEEKLPLKLPQMQLCAASPKPGDAVIVVDYANAARSHIVSPQILPDKFQDKSATLIGDVATTGNSGSGVFDPKHKCLLGIMSRKFISHIAEDDKEIAKYLVSAVAIRDFIPAEFTSLKW